VFRRIKKRQKATISLVRSVCLSVYASLRPSAWNKSAPIGRIFIKFVIWVYFEYMSRKFNYDWNPTRITLLYMTTCTFLLISG